MDCILPNTISMLNFLSRLFCDYVPDLRSQNLGVKGHDIEFDQVLLLVNLAEGYTGIHCIIISTFLYN